MFDADHLVFLDETRCVCSGRAPSVAQPRPPRQQLLTKHTPTCRRDQKALRRKYGRAPPGESHPRHGARALNPRALQPRGVRRLAPHRGRIRRGHVPCRLRDAALAYPEPMSVLVLDNAPIHHAMRDQLNALVAARGARIVWLPPYSPMFNPIVSLPVPSYASPGLNTIAL